MVVVGYNMPFFPPIPPACSPEALVIWQAQAAECYWTGLYQPWLLKAYASQLCGVLQHLFNLNIHLQKVPVLWKTSCSFPVHKKKDVLWQVNCTDLSHHEGHGTAGSSNPCWGWWRNSVDRPNTTASCYSTYPVPLTPSRTGCWRTNWRRCRWILPLSP